MVDSSIISEYFLCVSFFYHINFVLPIHERYNLYDDTKTSKMMGIFVSCRLIALNINNRHLNVNLCF